MGDGLSGFLNGAEAAPGCLVTSWKLQQATAVSLPYVFPSGPKLRGQQLFKLTMIAISYRVRFSEVTSCLVRIYIFTLS